VDARGAVAAAGSPSVFVLFRDSPLRRAALAAPPGAGERYALHGLDELRARGFAVRHSLEPAFRPRAAHRAGDRVLRAAVARAGGYGGDFAAVLACRRAANAADVVLSTVDTVGIPAALLARAGVLRRPLVYVSIGLLDRVARLRNEPVRRLYRSAIRGCAAVVAYGHAEADELRRWLGPGTPVRFVPFGVDTEAFRPAGVEPDLDVLSVGADPQRDYALLERVVRRLPGRGFTAVVSADQARELRDAAPNLAVASELPFREVQARVARARVVALPVRDNLYSGATTTLLHAMAAAKPVVVSRTAAIADGYGLVDGANVRLVPPGDDEAFAAAVEQLLADPVAAAALGARARETVERELGWERYAGTLAGILREAAGQASA
jgi:glycosyltransferase involved in cell wall biosynthesis